MAVFIIDDHRLFRTGLAMILSSHLPGVALIEYDGIEEALAAGSSVPALILLDISLDGIDGIEGLALVKQRWPETPVAMVSAENDSVIVQRSIDNGAVAFVTKSAPAQEIVAVVTRLLPQMAAEAGQAPTVVLTPRQRDILLLVQEGLSNKRIATSLSISEFTVRGHVQTIIGALGASSRTQAVYTAQRCGIL